MVKWCSIGSEVVGVSEYGGLRKVLKVPYHDTHQRPTDIHETKPKEVFDTQFYHTLAR